MALTLRPAHPRIAAEVDWVDPREPPPDALMARNVPAADGDAERIGGMEGPEGGILPCGRMERAVPPRLVRTQRRRQRDMLMGDDRRTTVMAEASARLDAIPA